MPTVPKTQLTVYAGDNWIRIKKAVEKRTEEFVSNYGDIAVEKIDGSEAEVDQILGAIKTPSFLIPKKLCIIHDLSKNKESQNAIEQILDLDVEDTEIILVEGKLDKRSAYYKLLKKQTEFEEYEELDERSTIEWMLQKVKEDGGSLNRRDGEYIYSLVGGNQSRLENELNKLLAHKKEISKDSIEALVQPQPSSTVFDLLNAAFSGNSKKAMSLYEDQRLQKVEPQKIFGMIAWQMHIVALVDSAKGMGTDDISKQAGLNPFVVKKSKQISGKLTPGQINRILEKMTETDHLVKTTSVNPDDAIKNLLIEISSS